MHRLQNIKQNYFAKSPLEKWDFVRQIQIILLKMFGLQILDSKFKAHFGTLLPFYLLFNYGGLLVYTLIYYRKDPLKALIATPPLGIYAPVSYLNLVVKFMFYFYDRKVTNRFPLLYSFYHSVPPC